MPRGRGKVFHLECTQCSHQFVTLLFRWEDDDDSRNNNHVKCPSCNHEYVRRMGRPGAYNGVQVRESQRAVVYEYADGTWAQPGTNDPNDPIAMQCRSDGAVRREFFHVEDLREFNREHRGRGEQSGYNDVVDWDQTSLRHGDAETIDMANLHRREAHIRNAFEMLGGSGNTGRYERAAQELRRRGIK